MNKIIKKKRLIQEEIEAMMESALLNAYLVCPYCEYGELEPDYESCPEYNKANPLRALGLI